MATPSRSRLFVGYSSVDSSIKQTQYIDLELIKRDLINHFFTRRGERVFRPNFGCIVWDLLYEPLTPDNVSLIVEDATNIVQSDGRVSLDSINLVELEHGIQIQMNIRYQPLNIVQEFSLNFDRRNVEGTVQ